MDPWNDETAPQCSLTLWLPCRCCTSSVQQRQPLACYVSVYAQIMAQ